MEIIIVGCGKVGFTIAKDLSKEDNNVIIVDKKIDAFGSIVESIDAMVVKGNCLSAKILQEANVKYTDLIICVTNSDETNILCCLTAKRLGAKHTIARVRDPEYALELYKFRKDLGLDMIINPEYQAALEISRLIRFPSVDGIDTFVGGRVEMVSFKITDQKVFIDKSVSQIFSKIKIPILLAMIERREDTIIPHGDFIMRSEDIVRVIGKPTDITEFFRYIGLQMVRIRDVMIIGGGIITHYLADFLLKHHIKIKIIEIDEEKCERLSEALHNCIIIHGDGTDEEILNSENVKEAGAVVCLTDMDEENVIISLYAAQCGVTKTIVKINRINLSLVKNLGVGSIICPKNLIANQIIRYVRELGNSADSSNITSLYKIVDKDNDRIEILEFNVSPNSECINIPLMDLKLKKGILIGCIVGRGNIIIPVGSSVIRPGDTVIVLSKNTSINNFEDILS